MCFEFQKPSFEFVGSPTDRDREADGPVACKQDSAADNLNSRHQCRPATLSPGLHVDQSRPARPTFHNDRVFHA